SAFSDDGRMAVTAGPAIPAPTAGGRWAQPAAVPSTANATAERSQVDFTLIIPGFLQLSTDDPWIECFGQLLHLLDDVGTELGQAFALVLEEIESLQRLGSLREKSPTEIRVGDDPTQQTLDGILCHKRFLGPVRVHALGTAECRLHAIDCCRRNGPETKRKSSCEPQMRCTHARRVLRPRDLLLVRPNEMIEECIGI